MQTSFFLCLCLSSSSLCSFVFCNANCLNTSSASATFATLPFALLVQSIFIPLFSASSTNYPRVSTLAPLPPLFTLVLFARKLIRQSSSRGKRGRGREIESSTGSSSSCCCGCCSCSLSLQQLLQQWKLLLLLLRVLKAAAADPRLAWNYAITKCTKKALKLFSAWFAYT